MKTCKLANLLVSMAFIFLLGVPHQKANAKTNVFLEWKLVSHTLFLFNWTFNSTLFHLLAVYLFMLYKNKKTSKSFFMPIADTSFMKLNVVK